MCSIVRERDPDGHTIHYRRDAAGRLARIEAAANRWIAFACDGQNRITRAYDSTDHEMRYEYDNRGRLSVATATDGRTHRYTYTRSG
ncbi:MAG: hypothetical protein LC804_20910 [Acidobacteria bacterium]|nr:hypothetical protein [Acidobacteriota bacterium]